MALLKIRSSPAATISLHSMLEDLEDKRDARLEMQGAAALRAQFTLHPCSANQQLQTSTVHLATACDTAMLQSAALPQVFLNRTESRPCTTSPHPCQGARAHCALACPPCSGSSSLSCCRLGKRRCPIGSARARLHLRSCLSPPFWGSLNS